MWPQYTYLAMVFIGLILTAALNGKPKTGNHNFSLSLMAVLLGAFILYSGGFFDPLIQNGLR